VFFLTFIAPFLLTCVLAVDWGTALHIRSSDVRILMSLEFFIDIILPAALWPWGRLKF